MDLVNEKNNPFSAKELVFHTLPDLKNRQSKLAFFAFCEDTRKQPLWTKWLCFLVDGSFFGLTLITWANFLSWYWALALDMGEIVHPLDVLLIFLVILVVAVVCLRVREQLVA